MDLEFQLRKITILLKLKISMPAKFGHLVMLFGKEPALHQNSTDPRKNKCTNVIKIWNGESAESKSG